MNALVGPPLFVFVDLDDTLFCSARKCPPGALLEPAALLQDGAVISYTSPGQRRLLHWLRQGATLIPVTARSLAGYARVLLTFEGPAVVSFGAVILDNAGRPDPKWVHHMQATLAAAQPLLTQAGEALNAAIAARGLDAWARGVGEFGQTQYLLAKHRGADVLALEALRIEVLQPWAASRSGWRVFQNDNNLVLLPPGLDKAHAVAHLMAGLRSQHGDILSIGIGDSFSDAGFLGLCDFAMTPSRTQLAQRLCATEGD
jgi:hydroxymethylpyrimidine pyrophosphatase-like HAD family hydrolase